MLSLVKSVGGFVESNVRVRSFALVGILLVAAACADSSGPAPIDKTPLLRLGVASHTGGKPTRFANSKKYRDKGLKAARASAGSASLEARALLGKDGLTTLDISTGAIDAPSGLLKKIELKLYAPNGTLQSTTKYDKLSSPTYQLTLPGRVRGSALQVKADIVGIDSRSASVTVKETVKLRPDVSVDRITAPAQSQLTLPVQISALISENNGDVGARADCVLAVDGVEADRARGIWVDAGRSVSCLFMHVFPTTGTKQLTVSAISVIPGDWNALNNIATQTIRIVLPSNEFTWEGGYYASRNYIGTQLSEGYATQPVTGEREDWRLYQDTRRNNSWGAHASGQVGLMTGPLAVSFRDEIDGNPLTLAAFDPIDIATQFEGTQEDPALGSVHFQTGCIDEYVLITTVFEGREIVASPIWVTLCKWELSGASGPLPDHSFTTFFYNAGAGDVSYYAEQYRKYEDGTPDGLGDFTFSFNGDVQYSFGNIVFGNDYSFVFKISGSDQSKTASGTIHTTTFDAVVSQPYRCDDSLEGVWVVHTCSAADFRQTVTSGTGSGTPDE
jgi:hypothetical protein